MGCLDVRGVWQGKAKLKLHMKLKGYAKLQFSKYGPIGGCLPHHFPYP